MTKNEKRWRPGLPLVVICALLGFLTPMFGERAWWIMPPLMFAAILGLMLIDRRRPITARWVLLAAGISVAVGAVLRVT